MRRHLIALFIVLGALFLACKPKAEPPLTAVTEPPLVVAASIKPIHSLIAGVMEGIATPLLIIKGTASPHTYTLKPSDAGQLSQAQIVFFVSPKMEAALATTLAALADQAHVIELAALPVMGISETASDGELHIWLDPGKARAIVATAVAQLIALDPENAMIYRANGQHLSQRLDDMEMNMRFKLEPLAKIPFIVFHDAYTYLARAYHLNIAGVVANHPETPPSAKRMSELRQIIKDQGVRCLFNEPQFDSRLGYALTDGTKVKTGYLDPVGGALDPGLEQYFQMMQIITDSLADCLRG